MLGHKQCFWRQKTKQYCFLSALLISLGLGLLLSTGQAFAGELHDAAKAGDLDMVKKLLEQGVPVNEDVHAGRGTPPLHGALYSGNPEIIELLLAHGADVNKSHAGHTVLYQVPRLDPRWINSKERPEAFTAADRVSIAEILLSFGAEVDALNFEKTSAGPYEEDYDLYSAIALHIASMHGEADVVAVLLKHNANPQARVQLKDRVRHHYPHGRVYSGIGPTLLYVFDRFENPAGMTPLHFAAWGGSRETIEHLLTNGADIHATDDEGRTPLHFTAYSSKGEAAAQLLLDRGAEIDAYSRSGRIPLHLCVQRNNTAVAALLLAHGADINAEDNEGKLPLDFAAQHTDDKLMALLDEYGAKE